VTRESTPPLLPDTIRQHIFAFSPEATPDLVAAACITGNTAPVAPPHPLTEENLAGFLPDLRTVTKKAPPIQEDVVRKVQDLWLASSPTRSSEQGTPLRCWGDDRGPVFTPLTLAEQQTLTAYAEAKMQDPAIQALVDHERLSRYDRSRIVMNIGARVLGTTHDIVAIPRILAARTLLTDREKVTKHLNMMRAMNTDPSKRLVHTLSLQEQLEMYRLALDWKMPCTDLMPLRRGNMERQSNVAVRQLIELCEIAVIVAPERFAIPLESLDPEELRSPFRANSQKRIMEVIAQRPDEVGVWQQVFWGERLELANTSNGPRPPRWIAAEQKALQHPTQETPTKTGWQKHAMHLAKLQQSELGQEITAAVTSQEIAHVELRPREPWHDPVELSRYVEMRLRNVARVFYDLEEDSVPPQIALHMMNTEEIFGRITRAEFRDVQSVHMRLDPIQRSTVPKAGHLRTLRVALLVKKNGPGQKYDGAYFSISVGRRIRDGYKPVGIKYEERLLPEQAEALTLSNPSDPETA